MNVNKHENWQVQKQPDLSFRNYITEMVNSYALWRHFTKKSEIVAEIFSPALEIRF